MNLTIKQMSSMYKIRSIDDMPGISLKNVYNKRTLLKGQHFSYQISAFSDEKLSFSVSVDSLLKECVKLYVVKNTYMDHPVNAYTYNDEGNNDYITKERGYMPDMLLPLEEQNGFVTLGEAPVSIWVELDVPKDLKSGKYDIDIVFTGGNIQKSECGRFTQKMSLDIIDAVLPKQKTVYTQWFHVDCIANYHRVDLYSEKHWELIDSYMSLANKLGINMLLTPVLTPSLDIAEGMYRAKTQLTDIEKKDDSYIFDFSKLRRWIALCKKNGIEYLEIAHLFSQWGLKYSPNIVVKENGAETYMFGWHTSARDPKYKEFLEAFLPALVELLRSENCLENTRFHISDEPSKEHLDEYRYAHSVVRPLIENCKIMDAISDYEFYKNGLMDIPIPINSSVSSFIENKVEELYTYYCCGPDEKESNRFMAMPSYRNRIIGLQMYKYDIKGFLHWGYNFYNSQLSKYQINPYLTTSADCGFPSGDPFSVYPYKDGAIPSIRAMVFRDALEDMEICRRLEEFIGKDAVIELIENEAQMAISFSEYPRNNDFIVDVMEKISQKLGECISKSVV